MIKENRYEYAYLGAALLYSALSCGTAWAAAEPQIDGAASASNGAGEYLGEIVVTARKRVEVLRDVPAAISALSEDSLQTRGVTSIDDLGRQTPGLIMSERQNRVPNVVMRGIGSYGFVEGVGFYIDDVQNFTDKTMRLEDLERVEILKGPQATLFGGSSLAGAVRYISKRPSFTPKAEARASIGENDYYNLYLSANAPVAGDAVAARVSGYYTHDDGFVDDSNLLKPTSEFREYGVRGQLLFEFNDRFSSLITLRYRDYDGAFNTYIREDSVKKVDTHSTLSLKPNLHTKTFGVVAEFKYDLNFAELLSLSSYTRQKSDVILDGDYTPFPALTGQSDTYPSKIYTQELRLTSAESDTFDWIVGLYASKRENAFGTAAPLVITAAPGVIAPVELVIDPFLDVTAKQTEIAGFATGNLHLGDFTVSAGARLMRTKYKSDSKAFFGMPNSGVQSVTDTAFLPKVTLSYKMAGGTLLFASVAEGYESGKVDSGAAPATPYAPETNWTYEIGAKGDLGPALYYELSAYYIDSSDRQTETVYDAGGGVFLKAIRNIGDARTYGAEASVRWKPVTGLTLDGALGYLDAKWTDASYAGVSLRGKRIPNASPWTANFGATYFAPVADDLALTLHFDAAYRDEFPWQITYDPISNTNPSYWLANARIGLGPDSGKWEAAIRVDNLFDQKYYTEFFPQQNGPQNADGTCVQCHTGAIGGLRRLVLSLGVKF